MKRVVQKLFIFMISLCMTFAVFPIGVKANDDPQPGALTMSDFRLEWVEGATKTTIDGDKIEFTPNSNNPENNWVKAKVQFSCGGDEGVETGNVEIRIPHHILKDRDGNPTGTLKMSIPEAPDKGGNTSFNYTIDETTDEIVIRNYEPIPPGGFFMSAEISWCFDPLDVKSNSEFGDVQAKVNVTGTDGENGITATTNPLSGKVNTKPELISGKKEVNAKNEKWQEAWGDKPDDADDYFYIVWHISQSVHTSSTTSPYTLYFVEEPGDGEPVAWADYFSGDEVVFQHPDPASSKSALEQLNEDPVSIVVKREDINSAAKQTSHRMVVMRYPRTLIADGKTPKIENKVTAKAVTPENIITEKVHLSNYTYQHVSGEVPYPGNSFSMYKRARSDWKSEKDRIDKSNYKCTIQLLRAGYEVPASWSIDVKNMSWTLTNGGTKTYDTVLRDGMMYIGGERLLPGDYELLGFKPAQYDIYGPGWTEDDGWFLGVRTDYEDVYDPIKVYIEDKEGNWSEYGTLNKTGENAYSWTDMEGTTSNVDLTEKYPVKLPSGTQDIKYVHTGAAYGVEYRMNLYYTLKPSDHLLKLIGDTTTEFNLININEAWGEQDGKIYTEGNKFNSEGTTATIKADVEASDKAEFIDNDRFATTDETKKQVMHDYSEHVYTGSNGSSQFSKSIGSPENKKDLALIRIPVTIKWENMWTYKYYDLTVEEAIAVHVVDEAKEGMFYDLLPIGVTVDPATIKVTATNTANIYGKKAPEFPHTLELVENWRDSGRTMMIVHAQVPENYVNFDRLTGTLWTGFLLTYDMIDTYDNIDTNGSTVENTVAYYSLNGPTPSGNNEGPKDETLKELFKDLAYDGESAENKGNVEYQTSSKTLNIPVAGQMHFTKRVKSASDTIYGKTATVPATGEYSYQLRFPLSDGSKAKNVVMYDVLETAYGDKEHWNGTFKGLDISNITKQFPDVAPVIYYSTSKAFGNLSVDGGVDFTDLTNEDLWTTSEPEDLSKVTAIAIDISKDVDGNIKEYEGKMAVSAQIYMEAPANYQDYIDDPDTEADETVYAYNQAFISQDGFDTKESDTTTVEIEEPDVDVEKTSDPRSGTEENPTLVEKDAEITYYVDVTNNNGVEAINSVKIVDAVPEGLQIKKDGITYKFGIGAEEKPSANGRVQMTVDGQTLTFVVDKLLAGEKIHISIPVVVSGDHLETQSLDNQARVTEFNNQNWSTFESEETHHERAMVSLDLPVKKVISGSERPEGIEKTFTFELTGADKDTPMPENSENGISTLTLTDEGKGNFDTLEFYKEGTYTYTLKEREKPEEGYTGYSFDTTEHTIVVTVKKDDDGKLTLSWTDNDPNNDAVTFENEYAPKTVDVTLPVEKRIEGNERPENGEKKFTFVLESLNDGPLPEEGKETVTIEDQGRDKFGTITFSNAGTYNYRVSEVAGRENGYTYSTAVKYIRITVVDNDGKLETTTEIVDAEGNADAEGIVFTNEYKPDEAIVELPVVKEIEGNERSEEKEFEFDLKASANEPMPAEGKEKAYVTGEGMGLFGKITFTEAGTYSYTISETNTGENGYTYDDAEYQVTVIVKDVDGVLAAAWTIEGDDAENPAAVFVNTYEPSETTAVLSVEKQIKGDKRKNEEAFTFILKNNDSVDTVMITGEGTATFKEIVFNQAGVYEYEISEKAGTAEGYTYSKDVYTATINVVDVNGKLESTVIYSKNGKTVEKPVFVNTYKKTVDVKTGYESHILIWMTLCMAGLLGACVIMKNRRNA